MLYTCPLCHECHDSEDVSMTIVRTPDGPCNGCEACMEKYEPGAIDRRLAAIAGKGR